MKKLICYLLVYLFCQLIPFSAYAVVVGYSRTFGGGAIGACAGAQTLGLEPDGSIASTTYTLAPDDCTDGATTATVNGSVTVEAGPYLAFAGAEDYLSISNSPALFNSTSGTVTFELYITSFVDNDEPIRFSYDAVNFIYLRFENDTNNHLRCYTKGDDGTLRQVDSIDALSNDTWYTVTLKWRTGSTNPALSLDTGGTAATEDDDLTVWGTEPSEILIGNSKAGGAAFRIRNVRLYNVWQ